MFSPETFPLSQLSHLNLENLLIPPQIPASLGQTLLLFGKPTEPQKDYQSLADAYVNQILAGSNSTELVDTGYLLGNPIFEYESAHTDPAKKLHILVWFKCQNMNPDHMDKVAEILLYLLWFRHKIQYVYHQSRWCNARAQKIYGKLSDFRQRIDKISHGTNQQLRLRHLLKEIQRMELEYVHYLDDLAVHENTIAINEQNYQNKLEKLQSLPETNLGLWQQFLSHIRKKLQQQIQTDLRFLGRGRDRLQYLKVILQEKIATETINNDMPGIPDKIYIKLCNALLDCDQFDNVQRLRNFFKANAPLTPWQYRWQAGSPSVLVEDVIGYLYDKFRGDTKENVLVILVSLLANSIDPADARHHVLAELAEELNVILSPHTSNQALKTMKGLSAALYQECTNVLLECNEFENITYLRGFCEIVTPLNELVASHLVEAGNKKLLVMLNLKVLLKIKHQEYGYIFPLFLQILRDNYNEQEERWNKIDTLRKKVIQELDNQVKEYQRKTTWSQQDSGSQKSLGNQIKQNWKCSFNWLHLTDLHRGMKEQRWLWPGMKEIFFADLQRLHDKCGPWDLVLFTGDLTQRGSAEEFQKLDELMKEIWDCFDKLGSSPKLLAVPGNHDLVRPNEKDPAVRLLQQWLDLPDIQEEFWEDADSPYRQVVTKAFENYMTWWDKQTFKPKDLKTGILPGDFSATIEKEGAKLGIVGLNTSFLQLIGGNYEGKLALHPRQFHQVCNGDGSAWTKQHNACLLLTHHPPGWLNPDSQRHLKAEITSHRRFVVHLCGHLHEASSVEIVEDGADARRIWQGRSLFGLEYYSRENTEVERLHGYTAGKVEMSDSKGNLLFWPRETRLQGGQRNIVPDYSQVLTDNQHTKPKEFELLQPYVILCADEYL